MRETDKAAALLGWYDKHARELPWRIPPDESRSGVLPDPYRVWLSEVMLQQTTVAAVGPYFRAFTERWPTVIDLAEAEDADVMAAWAGLGYYARARNLLKCARVIARDHGGKFPATRASLQKLPGIGPYTASAIAAIAFQKSESVVDGNVERVMARLHAIEEPLPKSKSLLTELAGKQTPAKRPGDYAQAVMDLGATICTPRAPACGICPLMDGCEGRKQGIAPGLPRKVPKPAKPTRRGIAYVARRSDGAFLVETRDANGLLGGMLGWPTSDWSNDPTPAPPIDAQWQATGLEVRHTFTHFHLVLSIEIAETDEVTNPHRGWFSDSNRFQVSDMPTVMRKVHDLALQLLEHRPSVHTRA